VTFREAIEKRVLVFDGAMGTQIQGFDLKASDFGGKEGANDLLTLTRPDLVEAIHARYFAAGCDVVETNTFGSSRLKLDEYGLGHRTYEVNFRAAILARRAAEKHATPGQPRFVAGSIGPTGMLPSSSDPALSSITGDALEKIFCEQARALIDGGADAILIETQQDILELRAAVLGADAARRDAMRDVFLIAQPTLIDASGRMLLGTDISAALATMERLHRPRRDAGERPNPVPEVEPLRLGDAQRRPPRERQRPGRLQALARRHGRRSGRLRR
jgi:5-methyltetrahydrofolate--homocysteine methyltransferase